MRPIGPIAFAGLAFLAGLGLGIAPSHAGKPIPWTATFCVVDGLILNVKGTYQPVRLPQKELPDGKTAIADGFELPTLEGKQFTLVGSLLPGDLFIAKRLDGKVVGCEPATRKKLTPAMAMALRSRAEWHAENQRYDAAIADIDRAIKLEP